MINFTNFRLYGFDSLTHLPELQLDIFSKNHLKLSNLILSHTLM